MAERRRFLVQFLYWSLVETLTARDASEASTGIYQAGLATIKARFAE